MREPFVVIIGIGEYASPDVPALRFAAADARAFHDFVRSPAAGLGGVPADNVRLLLDGDATARNIRAALTSFLRRSTPNDVIMVFIVAHGMRDPFRLDDSYLIAHDSEIDALAGTAIRLDHIQRDLEEAFAYNKMRPTTASGPWRP